MRDPLRRASLSLLFFVPGVLGPQAVSGQPLSLLDVPFISQSEALCGGAAAAMVLRYWGDRELTADAFAHLVDRSAAGIRTATLTAELQRRGWNATAAAGTESLLGNELARGRPAVVLIEDRPDVFHYVVIVAWHDRGVVLHDPARAPHRVMTREEFMRRWQSAGSWMLVLLPGAAGPDGRGAPAATPAPGVTFPAAAPVCQVLVEEGVQAAQRNDLEAAERALLPALGCSGGAAMRELAGVRLLQRRFQDVAPLAAGAVEQDAHDTHAWKLLGTGLFLTDERDAALEAWNRAGEPRVDLVRIDNLTRTRHRVVERFIGLETGTTLTAGAFARARRRLLELPSSTSGRLDYVPAPGGLAEVRATVTEGPLYPSNWFTYAGIGLTTAATRELRMNIGSPTGGGERASVAWRFRRNRPRLAVGVISPAPWGGVWGVDAAAERQAFDSPFRDDAERVTGAVTLADWATGTVRWEVRGGIDRWRAQGAFAAVGGGLRFVTRGDRVRATLRTDAWLADARFAAGEITVDARTSNERRSTVLLVSGIVQRASLRTPLDLWPAGDSGPARQGSLRAHPVLNDGRLRIDRLGRVFGGGSVEAQRWWPQVRRLQMGAAVFVDAARTGERVAGRPYSDVDLGAGIRFAVAGVAGTFRADIAKGLRDGATAASFVYRP